MPPQSKFTLKNIEDAIQRFKTEDLKAHVIPIFPEFKWSEIQDRAIKERLVLKKNVVSKILSKMFNQLAPEENDIKMRVCSLKLSEVSTYPSRRIWTAYQLQGAESSFLVETDPEQLNVALGRALRSSEITGYRQTTVHDGMFWIMILPTKMAKWTRTLQLQPPSFFAYAPGCPYVFAPRKRGRFHMEYLESRVYSPAYILELPTPETHETQKNNDLRLDFPANMPRATESSTFGIALKSALGYEKVKRLSLEGHDLRGLLQMLKCQQDKCAGASSHPMQLDPPELSPPNITVEGGNATISERNARIAYAEKVFGANPPALKTMTFHVKNMIPPDEIWGSEPMDVKITFHGGNVFETLKELTAEGVMRTPFPDYMHQILEKGKNIMVLQPKNPQKD